MKNSLLLLLLGFFIFASCKKDDSEHGVTNGEKKSIIPLAQGNEWNYRDINFLSDDTTYFSLSISGDTMIGSEHWYKEFYNDSSNYIFAMNKDDGHHFYTNGNDNLVFKYPANAGDQFISNDSFDTTIVLNTATMITVPAGQFSCYEYKSLSGNSGYTLLYVSAEVGIIKIIDYYNGNISYEEELVSYHLE